MKRLLSVLGLSAALSASASTIVIDDFLGGPHIVMLNSLTPPQIATGTFNHPGAIGGVRDAAVWSTSAGIFATGVAFNAGGYASFAGRGEGARGLTTRQYAQLVQDWVASIGLDPAKFGTHSLRRTKAVLIYRRTGNLRAVQLLPGHSKIESTVRYLGIEVDDAIEIAEKIDI